MDSDIEADSDIPFRIDQIEHTDYFFDSADHDNFNDFVNHSNNDNSNINNNNSNDNDDHIINSNNLINSSGGTDNISNNTPIIHDHTTAIPAKITSSSSSTSASAPITRVTSLPSALSHYNSNTTANTNINTNTNTNTNTDTNTNTNNNTTTTTTNNNNNNNNMNLNMDLGMGLDMDIDMDMDINMNMNMNMNMGNLDMMTMSNMNTMNINNINHLDLSNGNNQKQQQQQKHENSSTNINNNNNISRHTSDTSDIGEGTNLDNINDNDINDIDINEINDINITTPLEKTLTSNSNSSKQKSPKRSFDKRRGSMSINDDGGNQQKRTRASGEILEYLMDEFTKNSNPTTAMRKEISIKTGMPERSVRIWFQNRRAKARKMEKLNTKDINSSNNSNPITSNSINNLDSDIISPSTTFQSQSISNNNQLLVKEDNSTNLSNVSSNTTNLKGALSQINTLPIEINGKYYVIECKSLSVGNWQRIRSGYVKEENLKNLNNLSPRLLSEIMSTTDLLVILSKKDKELNYFFSGVFQNEKVLFRIFYPLINILKCSLLNQTQQMNNNENYNPDYNETLLQIELGSMPQFAVHFLRDPATGKENANQWSICEDFSEGQQVASAFIGEGGSGLPHILSDDLNRLKYFNTLITSINKSSPSSQLNNKTISETSTSTFPGPTPESQILNQSQFSPLNRSSSNNSTPTNINAMPYQGFPQFNSYLGLQDDELINSDLLYSLGNTSNLSKGSFQQPQSQPQIQMQQIQKQLQQQQQQQQNKTKQTQQQQSQLHNVMQQQQQQSLSQLAPDQRSLFQSQIQKKKLQQQQGNMISYNTSGNGSNSLLSSNTGLEGLFNPNAVDSDQGEGKLESNDLDIFRQDNNHDNNIDESLVKPDDENLTSNDPILLAATAATTNGRDALIDAAESGFSKQDNDNFFLDDGINGLGF
ncbi:Set1/Ash2 histone methyltransferase complex subunit ASH2 [Pichia californica]|uniref:Set1/Ash2 histone methyltransferase complex subunit ASH2 n=1 Tax=Pichia californica TaxID=460514 RepID=A0A9P7BET9_9ASCO|nr:Set1/Ash2 histone methyltransferase complex subunit ASH2 [[Candida] californica]KAG0686688.1 Set1/Ash2 histone methyltransferase complex subunit ASH2 [[Candida] californica]